jgi:hypothetical protein
LLQRSFSRRKIHRPRKKHHRRREGINDRRRGSGSIAQPPVDKELVEENPQRSEEEETLTDGPGEGLPRSKGATPLNKSQKPYVNKTAEKGTQTRQS